MDILLSLFLGIGLSAACGFRIFVPLLIVSIACKVGYFTPSSNFEWLGSNTAIITFAIATVLEILAYYIPMLDNLLDTIATPIATIAGIIVMASSLGQLNSFLKWTLSIIAGGGIAGAIQLLTASTRATSTGLTAGLANPIISTIEAIMSIVISVVAIFLPIFAFTIIILIFYLIIKKITKKNY